MSLFHTRISSLKIHLNLRKLLYFSHYLINIRLEAADEIIAKVQHKFREVKIDIKTWNSSKKSNRVKNLS